MLTIYLVAVAFGGTLLGASLVLGGRGDHPALGDGAGNAGEHATHALQDHVSGGDLAAWLPLSSMRFWSFFMTFAGAVGTALTLGGVLASTALVGALAAAVGWLSGVGAVTAVRLAGTRSANSTTSTSELIGASGILLLGTGPGEPGKLRLDVKGRQQDFLVDTDDDAALPSGASVMVVATSPGGRLIVTRTDDFAAPQPPEEDR